MAGLKVTTQPAIEPVTLGTAKSHLRVDIHEDNALIEGYIATAREWCELYMGRAFVTQTLEIYLDSWPANGEIELPRAPLQSVTSVIYTDENGIEVTWADSNYLVSTASEPGRIVVKRSTSWPNATLKEIDGIKITYMAGYGTTVESVPQQIRSAILLITGDLYENRENTLIEQGVSVVEANFGAKALLYPARVFAKGNSP